MKNVFSVYSGILFDGIVLLPLAVTVSALFGYSFEPTSYVAFAVVTALLSAGALVISIPAKNHGLHKTFNIFYSLLMPLSIINALFYFDNFNSATVIISLFVSVVCCSFLNLMHGKPLALKIVTVVLSAVMVFPIGFLGFLDTIFESHEEQTVVETVNSPNGEYSAKHIYKRGTLDSVSFVEVQEDKGINNFIFKLNKKPKRINIDNLGVSNAIYWKSDACLVINGVEFEIDQ